MKNLLPLFFYVFLFQWIAAIIYAQSLCKNIPYSSVLYAKDGQLLNARVAKDGQWRFPQLDTLPDIYKLCLVNYEDKRFYWHPGVDVLAIARAIYTNIRHKQIVSGASSLTMQTIRLARASTKRNILQKLIEAWAAIGLESIKNKNAILKMYAALAPYGGNVVGFETALWRYYNKGAKQLSFAEAATLAVLPNQPSMIHLSRNRSILLHKRNLLLEKLKRKKIISSELLELSLLEEIPDKPLSMPKLAPHALQYLKSKNKDQFSFYSTINKELQEKIIQDANQISKFLRGNDIQNLSVLVIENKSKNILAYLGNVIDTVDIENADVDMIQAKRSSGSILKPFLFAAMVDKGVITEKSIYPDIPTWIKGFRPENFSRTYQGAVTTAEVIQQSLNIPSVKMLKDYTVSAFYADLKKLKFNSLFRKPEEYGLSLILGGAEVSSWDIGKAYAGLANTLQNAYWKNYQYDQNEFNKLNLLITDTLRYSTMQKFPVVFEFPAIYKMFDVMRGTNTNYDKEIGITRNKNISWKTGTSFGFKDAWAVGVTPDYTVVAWVGNASGNGRPGLIGLHTAAPLMFEIFRHLNVSNEWFIPYDKMKRTPICQQSGYIPGKYCDNIDTTWTVEKTDELKTCAYHQQIYVDKEERNQVFADCATELTQKNYFILPPIMEHYYIRSHLDYHKTPELSPSCAGLVDKKNQYLDFIYPEKGSIIKLPVDLDEIKNSLILKATHKLENSSIYWYLDNEFIGETKSEHSLSIKPNIGVHTLMILDEEGHSAITQFELK